jgi:hypothetical protein
MPTMFPVLATTVPADTDPGGMLAIVILVLLAAYAFACVFWPYVACRRCKGHPGKSRSLFGGSAWRARPRCEGKGRRVRLGRKVYEHIRGL